MSDIYERVAERMAMAITTDDYAYAIMARKRVRGVAGDETPTIDHYHAALTQCIADKAGDWRAACESAAAASKEIGLLKAEITRLRLTDAERTLICRLAAACDGGHPREWTNRALTADDRATLRGLLGRCATGAASSAPRMYPASTPPSTPQVERTHP